MAFLLKVLHIWGNICAHIFCVLMGIGEDPKDGMTMLQEYRKILPEQQAVERAEVEAMLKLSKKDQALMFATEGYFTPARKAKRKFYKNLNPKPFAEFYRSLGLSVEAAEVRMQNREKFPGYFRAKVRALMA